MATFAPSRAYKTATERPIPESPPVISADLPAIFPNLYISALKTPGAASFPPRCPVSADAARASAISVPFPVAFVLIPTYFLLVRFLNLRLEAC
jgi:hypothetical protein